VISDFTKQTKDLIDELKKVCADFGLGNDGNESKIITQTFLYKFLNDKLGYELKKIDGKFISSEPWESVILGLSDKEFAKYSDLLPTNTARLNRSQTISYLFNNQNTSNFAQLFDKTLVDISDSNSGIFSVTTATKSKITLFEPISQFVSDPSKKDDFCRALINKLVNFSFEKVFDEKFDFFSTIFEYLIKDYNKDGGGKYAEYYTPHAVSKIMAKILVDKPVKNVTVYDPSAGSGTLLMNVAHEIGEKNCTIFSQDISQKSSGMLRLNLILNDLVHSIHNVVQGNTLLEPAHKDKNSLKKFDYIVSNPPFKLDFSDFRDDLETPENAERFFAGIPNVPPKQKDKMAIYLLFLQHILHSLSARGKASIVVPTGFLAGQDSITTAIRKKIVDSGIFVGAIAMPSNIFANTGTNVSVIFIDASCNNNEFILVDATKLGETIRDGKNQRTILSEEESNLIIKTFSDKKESGEFSVIAKAETLAERNYSFSAGQYFKVAINYETMTKKEFEEFIKNHSKNLSILFDDAKKTEKRLLEALKKFETDND
jgi:type I restriction enzyme M protein